MQIAASDQEAKAEAEWVRLSGKNKDLLGGLPHAVARADLGTKGVFYRLRAGSFADKAAATALCDSLKARKVGCLIVRNP